MISRRDRLDELFHSGIAQYITDCPNATAYADAHLVCIGFIGPAAAMSHAGRIETPAAKLGLSIHRFC
jgi:hypothetical protein